MLGFNDMLTFVGHFVLSLREREKRDSRGDEREGQVRKRKMNESEEKEEIKMFLLYSYLLQGQQVLPNCKPISVGCPSDVRYTTPSPHPTTPFFYITIMSYMYNLGLSGLSWKGCNSTLCNLTRNIRGSCKKFCH